MDNANGKHHAYCYQDMFFVSDIACDADMLQTQLWNPSLFSEMTAAEHYWPWTDELF